MLTHELVPVAAALVLLAARFAWTLAHSAESRQSMEFRQAWVRRVMAQPGSEIMAVQTVRNSMMAASLMATSATLALIAVLTLGHARLQVVEADGWLHGPQIKLFLPVALLAACMVLFSKAVRLYHRSGYSLGLAKGASELHESAEAAAINELTRAAHLYRNGWRAFYSAIATGAWLVSGWMMLVTTIVIVGIDIAAKVE